MNEQLLQQWNKATVVSYFDYYFDRTVYADIIVNHGKEWSVTRRSDETELFRQSLIEIFGLRPDKFYSVLRKDKRHSSPIPNLLEANLYRHFFNFTSEEKVLPNKDSNLITACFPLMINGTNACIEMNQNPEVFAHDATPLSVNWMSSLERNVHDYENYNLRTQTEIDTSVFTQSVSLYLSQYPERYQQQVSPMLTDLSELTGINGSTLRDHYYRLVNPRTAGKVRLRFVYLFSLFLGVPIDNLFPLRISHFHLD